MKKTIFLCGFMGCGKTTVGKLLADKLEVPFYDLDEYIVQNEGMEISRIFAEKSEQYFRRVETEALKVLSAKGGCVIATGGGAMLSEENTEIALDNGICVYIDTPFEVCYTRIKDDMGRPIAANSSVSELEERYFFRMPVYKKHSSFSVDGNASPKEISDEILSIMKRA